MNKASITLLDGGVGQEVNKRAADVAHPLWSVKVMFDEPQIVIDVHEEFIKAGARIIALNTYTATPTRVDRDGFGASLEQIHYKAIDLAQKAVQSSGQPFGQVKIAGCLPPVVASYVAEVSKPYQASLDEYRAIVALQNEAVDLFMIETMSNIAEATAALDAAQETGKPVFLGLTVSDQDPSRLRSGEQLCKALEVLAANKPDAILLNCSTPEAISQALPQLARYGIPFGGYANGFTSIQALKPGGTTDSLSARNDLTAQAYAEFVKDWISQGATIVGGCCEVSPAHIAHLHQELLALSVKSTA